MPARSISLVIIVTALLAPVPGAQPFGQARSQPAAGMFLVADPGMKDPRFARSVVFLVEHSADGAMGLIVNRRSEVPVSEALSGFDPHATDPHKLYFGGPVEPGRIMYMHEGRTESPDVSIIENVSFGADYERLSKLVRTLGPASLRVYFGYAGWGAGQLEFELWRGDWQVLPARAGQIFSDDPGGLWKSLNRSGRGLITRAPAATSTRYL